MTEITQQDRRDVRQWRGLRPHVLDSLDRLDRDAIGRGDSFARQRREGVRSRARCRELRELHDLDIYRSLPR